MSSGANRQVVWQITQTHVHIQGHALLFKNISQNGDDVLSRFQPLPGDISLQQAEIELLKQPDDIFAAFGARSSKVQRLIQRLSGTA